MREVSGDRKLLDRVGAELRSSNQALRRANEELLGAKRELDTASRDLESLHEELDTLIGHFEQQREAARGARERRTSKKRASRKGKSRSR